jgi:hypothetical protein
MILCVSDGVVDWGLCVYVWMNCYQNEDEEYFVNTRGVGVRLVSRGEEGTLSMCVCTYVVLCVCVCMYMHVCVCEAC